MSKSKITKSFVRSITHSLSKKSNNQYISSNKPLSFPCLDKLEKKSDSLRPDVERKKIPNLKFDVNNTITIEQEIPIKPIYNRIQQGFELFKSEEPLFLDYGGVLPEFQIAYEHWGTLNKDKSNAILIHTGLSASSHAKSHPKNIKPGWWENFIGPDKPLDTNKFFIICTNVIGGCYGSTGPSSINRETNERYATRFPILSINDMTRAQNRLINHHFGIKKLYASVGSSMGGMQSLAYTQEFPEEVGKVVSISACARSHPYSIAMRHTQRQVLMSDPNWNRGFYYDGIPPHVGMKLSREIATVTYRSGPEWERRFGRERVHSSPSLCPDFLVETYLDHQGTKFSLEYDPNSLLYVSKAMDLFDLGSKNRNRASTTRLETQKKLYDDTYDSDANRVLKDMPINPKRVRSESEEEGEIDLLDGLKTIGDKEVLVIGVRSDILFPSWQQAEIAEKLKEANIKFFGGTGDNIKHHELSEAISQYGHDTFLIDLEHVGGPIKEFL